MSFVSVFHKSELSCLPQALLGEPELYCFFFLKQIASWTQIMGKHWITQMNFSTPC